MITVAREQEVVHQGNEGLALVALTTGQMNPNRDAMVFDQQMNLGSETAPRVAQGMFSRLQELPCFWPQYPRLQVWVFFPPRRQRG